MIEQVSRHRRYLALFLPLLPTDRLSICASPDPAAAGRPVVTVEMVAGGQRLAATDEAARRLGLNPGMTLADARALEPDLAVFEHDPGADARLLERCADDALRYTPMVAIDGGDGLLLDITGAAHLHGGEAALADHAADRLAARGLAVRTALGSTPEAAHALARYQTLPAPDERSAIRRLPVAALELSPEDTLGLQRAGLKQVGDLADRPSAIIAARFGSGAVLALDRLLGRSARPIVTHMPQPLVNLERRFAEPVARTAYMLTALKDLLKDAEQALSERGEGGRLFEARLFRTDNRVFPLGVETGRPMRDPARLARLFEERLEALADPIDPGFGFDMLRLTVLRAEPLAPAQPALDGDNDKSGKVDALVDALSTRVGRTRIRRFAPVDSHIPEQAQLAFPAVEPRLPVPWPVREQGEPPLRPIHIFDPPQPIDVIAGLPEGPPRQFRWRRRLHQVQRFEGPERIAPNWWQDDADRKLTRDYFRVEDVRGRRFWVFRHGLYGQEGPQPLWYLHGLFA